MFHPTPFASSRKHSETRPFPLDTFKIKPSDALGSRANPHFKDDSLMLYNVENLLHSETINAKQKKKHLATFSKPRAFTLKVPRAPDFRPQPPLMPTSPRNFPCRMTAQEPNLESGATHAGGSSGRTGRTARRTHAPGAKPWPLSNRGSRLFNPPTSVRSAARTMQC